jgi:hypothetical protein
VLFRDPARLRLLRHAHDSGRLMQLLSGAKH